MDEENIDINNIEIDKLQQAIANIAENSETKDEGSTQSPMDLIENIAEQKEGEYEEKDEEEDELDYKKYVLKINKKYKEIIDKMTLEEREQYFNDMLEFYVNNKAQIEKRFVLKESFIHVLVVVITIIIGLPLIFVVTNKSLELTVDNYKQTQNNFINLYREKGGIKKKDLTKLRKLK